MRKHKFLNIRGFSLVEVMVVGGILTIIGLGVMSLISNTTKSQRGLQAKDTMRDFAVEIRSTLSDKTACINTFATKNLSTDEATVTVVKDASNNAKYSAGTTYMNGLINFKNLVMREFVADATNPNIGVAKLFVYADKNGNTSGVKTIHHVLSAQIEMDAAKNILKCIAVGGLSDSLWQVSTANPNDIFFNGGKVGIGTTTPGATVHISSSDPEQIFNDAYGVIPGFVARRANGNQGSPTSTLQNDGLFRLGGRSYTGGGYTTTAPAAIQGYASENHLPASWGSFLTFTTTTNGTTNILERMRIDHNGNVGIGTTNPTTRLVVVTDEATSGLGPFLGHYYGNTNGAYIRLRSARGTTVAPTFRLSGDLFGGISWGAWNGTTIDAPAATHIGATATENHTTTASGAALIFGTTQNGTLAATGIERMRIDHNGNVGIGTISPSSLLEVMAGSGDGITIKANAATPQDSGDLIFKDYDGTERARIHANQGNSTSHSLWFDINGSPFYRRVYS